MKSLRITILILCLAFIIACNNSTSTNAVGERKDTSAKPVTDESFFGYKISWSDSSQVAYSVDTLLTHKGKAFLCDSAIALDYTGFLGEHTYMPLNENGQWINTIAKRKKLSAEQLQLVNSVFGNKKSFDNPMMVSCYEPRLGIVYFKDNKVIGQSAICLSCARLESTAKLGNGDNYSSFSEKTLRQLEKLCIDLQFSDCKHWQK